MKYTIKDYEKALTIGMLMSENGITLMDWDSERKTIQIRWDNPVSGKTEYKTLNIALAAIFLKDIIETKGGTV